MTKERLNDLESYKEFIKGRMSSDVPDKHKRHPETFKAYLKHELRLVEEKIQKIKLVG